MSTACVCNYFYIAGATAVASLWCDLMLFLSILSLVCSKACVHLTNVFLSLRIHFVLYTASNSAIKFTVEYNILLMTSFRWPSRRLLNMSLWMVS